MTVQFPHGSMLPPGSSRVERVAEEVGAARYPLPADLVRDVWNPATCPAHLLGYLAWGLSVDLWDESWPEVKKREVCRKALWLHRIKTTPEGIRAHVAIAGSEVQRIIRPPAAEFLRAALSEEAQQLWLDSLPQLRIYPFYNRGTVRLRHSFHSGPAGMRFHGPDARSHLLISRGPAMQGKRAVLFDRGEETEVTFSEPLGGTVLRVSLSRLGQRRAFHGAGFLGQEFISASQARGQVIDIRPLEDAAVFAFDREAGVTDVRPQRIALSRTAPAPRSFFGRNHLGRSGAVPSGFLRSSHAPLLIFDRFCLIDPSRMVARRRVRGFHGHGRHGIAPFTAELRIQVPMQRFRARSGKWHGNGYRAAANMKPLHRAIEAVRVSKALRDTVLIDTTTMHRARFGSGLRFGHFTFGEIRKAA